jgi:hypothetical protein
VTVKYKVRPRNGCEGPEVRSSYRVIVTRWGGGWPTPRPGRIIPGKGTWYPLYKRLRGPYGRSGRVRKTSPIPGFDSRNFQPVPKS